MFTTPQPKKCQSLLLRQKSASPWRVTRYSPYLARNPLVPESLGPALDEPVRNPLYQDINSKQRPEKIVRLVLSFSLLENGIPRGPNQKELSELRFHFPTMRSASYSHPFLTIRVETLPVQPWPTFVADLPLWLTASSDDEPPHEIGKMARAVQKFDVDGEIKFLETPSVATVTKIFKLINTKGAGINRIRWDGAMFRCFGTKEPEHGWQDRLPNRINGFAVSFFWTISSVEEHALRMRIPTEGMKDDTEYKREQLRPGVMVSGLCNNLQDVLETTSGICVESPSTGKKFITVAAHGFTAGIGDLVYHPKLRIINGEPDGAYQIGKIDRRFGDTDIALVELLPGIRYSRETFSDDQSKEPMQPFRRLKDPALNKVYDTVFMNTPVNGLCEGVHTDTQWTLGFEATDQNKDEERTYCEISVFSYWGNGSDTFFEGCCGGVIWDGSFDVLGQFRFQEKGGKRRVYAPSFTVLMDQGYQLSTI